MIRKIGFLLVISFLSISAFTQQVINVDAKKFNELANSGKGVILDVRTPEEYSRGHIENATLINIADRDFISKVSLLQKENPVYIYCLTGSRSRAAANYMAQMGFKTIYNLTRGILEWQSLRLPVAKSDVLAKTDSKIYNTESFSTLVKSGKLVLVDFHAPWCAPCKTMSPIIDEVSSNYKGKIVVEKIDIESNRALAEANQIQSIPGFILYKNGQKVWTYKGVISLDDLSKIINQYM